MKKYLPVALVALLVWFLFFRNKAKPISNPLSSGSGGSLTKSTGATGGAGSGKTGRTIVNGRDVSTNSLSPYTGIATGLVKAVADYITQSRQFGGAQHGFQSDFNPSSHEEFVGDDSSGLQETGTYFDGGIDYGNIDELAGIGDFSGGDFGDYSGDFGGDVDNSWADFGE